MLLVGTLIDGFGNSSWICGVAVEPLHQLKDQWNKDKQKKKGKGRVYA
jgi:hypothetical protein